MFVQQTDVAGKGLFLFPDKKFSKPTIFLIWGSRSETKHTCKTIEVQLFSHVGRLDANDSNSTANADLMSLSTFDWGSVLCSSVSVKR